jgi:tRNA (uracil-5-)-methyltransferase TRM9
MNEGVFDHIAVSWYNFRHRTIFPRELEELAGRWRQGRLLNIGCAHGPDFPPFHVSFELYGIDISRKMLELAQRYASKYWLDVSLAQADARGLPFTDGYFDFTLAVASLHHIEGEAERLKALQELKRVLRPGGEAFITVWNRWQPRFWFRVKNVLVPWKSKEETYYRYYHLYSYGELRDALAQAGFKVIRLYPESRYHFPIKFFSRNICALVKRP